jgi:hypothetical protein
VQLFFGSRETQKAGKAVKPQAARRPLARHPLVTMFTAPARGAADLAAAAARVVKAAVVEVSTLGDAKSSLGDATSPLGDR